jgi:hypothetical protein
LKLLTVFDLFIIPGTMFQASTTLFDKKFIFRPSFTFNLSVTSSPVSHLPHPIFFQRFFQPISAGKVFASLAANDEEIRKRLIETDHAVESVVAALQETEDSIKMAAIRCLHSLSRWDRTSSI